VTTTPVAGLQLAAVLADVRREIVEAARQAQYDDIRFEVASVRVDLTVALERSAGGKGGVKLWVLEAGAQASAGRTTTHTLSLELSPTSLRTGAHPWVNDTAQGEE
jgi:hypothetical protein